MDHYDGSYLYIFLTSALKSETIGAVFSLLFVFLARILPIITLAPFLGAKVLPHPIKMVLGLCLFTIMLPQLLYTTTTQLTFNPYLIILVLKEFFVGTLIGFIISVPFLIVQSTGQIIDHQRGGASLMVNDPSTQTQSSPLGVLFNLILIYIFFLIDGPFLFLNALVTSYELIPADQLLNPHFFDPAFDIWDIILKLFNTVMVISIQLAAPALLAILMTDAFLGVANRLAPQVQITFLGMPLKSLLALVVVCFGWKHFTAELVHQSKLWLEAVNDLLFKISTLPS